MDLVYRQISDRKIACVQELLMKNGDIKGIKDVYFFSNG